MAKSGSKIYFLRHLFFSHEDGWAESYLANRESRLMYKLRHLGNSFWENFGSQRISFLKGNKILLRTKHLDTELTAIVLTQIWRSKRDYDSFLTLACKGIDLESELKQQGISIRRHEGIYPYSVGPKVLRSVRANNHIVQYITYDWYRRGMAIGDPLKSGRLYLPFPND